MSINHFFLGTTGCRSRALKEGERRFERMEYPNIKETPFSVRLNHGGGEVDGQPFAFAIDDLFFFETEGDAWWFATEGYKNVMYEGETHVDTLITCITCGCGKRTWLERSLIKPEEELRTFSWSCKKCNTVHEIAPSQ